MLVKHENNVEKDKQIKTTSYCSGNKNIELSLFSFRAKNSQTETNSYFALQPKSKITN